LRGNNAAGTEGKKNEEKDELFHEGGGCKYRTGPIIMIIRMMNRMVHVMTKIGANL
jgi:hypothetical protein